MRREPIGAVSDTRNRSKLHVQREAVIPHRALSDSRLHSSDAFAPSCNSVNDAALRSRRQRDDGISLVALHTSLASQRRFAS
jgi:hypothetical protein